jgi:AraC-like DNA-binding protein
LYPFSARWRRMGLTAIDPALRPELTLVGTTTITARWSFLFDDPYWRLYRNQQDGAWLDHSRSRTPLAAGRAYLVPPRAGRHSGCAGRVEHAYVQFRFDLPPARGWPPPVVALGAESGLLTALDAMWRAEGAARLLQAEAAVALALTHLRRGAPAALHAALDARLAARAPVAWALAGIHADRRRPPPVAALAGRCALTPDRFARVFRHATGRSPARYLRETRIHWAADELLAGDRPLAGIAADAGFANRYHFSRVFRAVIGVPPAAWRRRGPLSTDS